DMRQDVEGDWNNYIHVNRDRYPQHGTVDFAFWGGDMLAKLLDTYLYDEFLFPEEDRQRLRKTIAVVDQIDHEPTAFYELVHHVLFERGVPTGKGPSEVRAREKALRLIDLSLLVVFRWGLDANNLRV